MKNVIFSPITASISIIIFFTTSFSAIAADSLDRFDMELNLGYRVDQFDWNIAGQVDGTNPNIISELTWDDLKIAEIKSKARVVLYNKYYPFGGVAKASVNYGMVFDGDNQDSDYGTDNRTNEFSRSNNKGDDGDVWDLSAGAGLVFKSKDRKFIFSPLFGVSYHAQNLTLRDGYQTISEPNPFDPSKPPPPVGPIEGLNSTYDAEWRSGWVGVDLEYQPSPTFELYGSIELHSAEYEADANWNLRDDFRHPISFEQDSRDEATGIVANFGAKVGLNNFMLNLDLCYQEWQVEDGIDRTYFSNGTIGVTRVNEVNWESLSASVGLTTRF